VDAKITSDDESGDESEDDYEFGEDGNNGDYFGAKSGNDTGNDKPTVEEINAHSTSNPTVTRGMSKIPQLSNLINKFSELIVRPIESHLENLVSEDGPKPELLIIPQGQTFNIPYATLRLQNGEPLCSMVSPHEAFSFHSFFYSTTLQQETKSQVND
jgi:hypothetical protein